MQRRVSRDGASAHTRHLVRNLFLGVVVGLLPLLAACPQDDGENGGNPADASADATMPDASPDTGVDGGPDGNGDTEMDGTGDVLMESDDDGIPDEEDNCPNTDNEDQKNTDRDNLGDACDPYPYIHGEDGPPEGSVSVTPEGNRPNDSFSAGENYDISLPFIVEGTVEAPEGGDGDRDFYSFEVDEPTAIVIHMSTESGQTWLGNFIAGYDFRNGNIQGFTVASSTGSSVTREIYFPTPGRYTIAATDANNLFQGRDAAGGEDYDYRMSVSKIPLPEPTELGVPGTAPSHPSDGKLRTYKVSTSGIDTLQATAQATQGAGQRGFAHPLMHVLDRSNNNETLGFNVNRQVTDTDSSSLKVRLEGTEEVTVVQDYGIQYQGTSTVLELSETTTQSEPETPSNRQNERSADHVWLQPGSTIDASIGYPESCGATCQNPDVDYFLVSANPGDKVRVVVEPKTDSKLKPRVRVGHWLAQQSGSNFIDQNGNQANPPSSAGQKNVVEWVYTSRSAGESVIQVQHAPNENADNPVGGPEYEYELRIEKWSASPTDMGDVANNPTLTSQATFESGELGLFEFTASKGDLLKVQHDEDAEGGFFDLFRVYSAQTFYQFAGGFDQETLFQAPHDGPYWVDIRDFDGSGTGSSGTVSATVKKVSAQDVNSLPFVEESSVPNDNTSKYYRLTAQAGQTLDFRFDADFFGDLQIYRVENFRQIAEGTGQIVRQFDEQTDLILRVAPRFQSGDFTLGVQEVQPTMISGSPPSESGTLDSAPFGNWYRVSVAQGEPYEVQLEQTGSSSFNPRIRVFEASSLNRIENKGSNQAAFRPEFGGDALIYVADNGGGGDPQYQYDLRMVTLSLNSAMTGQTKQGMLSDGGDRVFYEISVPPGAFEAEAIAQGVWTPEVRLRRANNLDVISDADNVRGLIRYAHDNSRDYVVEVTARDEGRSGPLNFEFTAGLEAPNATVTESEPNNARADATKITSFPAVISGSLSDSDEPDSWLLDLARGQRVWAMAMPRNAGNNYDLDSRLRFYTPDDTNITGDTSSGTNGLPALYGARTTDGGTHRLELSLRHSNDSEDYYIYVFTSGLNDVSEMEGNDSQMAAQSIGTVDGATRINATVNSSDPTDVYSFTLKRDLDELVVRLNYMATGYNLRVLDSGFNELAADGPAHGGAGNAAPSVTLNNLSGGNTYYVELKQGMAGGSVDIGLWTTP